MCTTRGRVKLLFAIYAFLICVIHPSCRAQVELNTTQDCSCSCGNIHNITYPFRLNTDPKHCGTNDYQLSCENNALMLYYNSSRGRVYGYRVEAINYNNLTIRLSDPNLHLDSCGLPLANRSEYDIFDYYSSTTGYNPWSTPTTGYLPWYTTSTGIEENTLRSLIFMSCEYPMSTGSVFEVYNSPCNLTRHWYLSFDKFSDVDDHLFQMGDSCRVEARAFACLEPTAKKMSYADVNNTFDYGFELSWQPACSYTSYNCSLYRYSSPIYRNRPSISNSIDGLLHFLDNMKVTYYFQFIFNYLDRTVQIKQCDPLTEEYSQEYLTICGPIIYFFVALLAVLALQRELLFFLGAICVTIFLTYKWRKRHQSAYDNVEEFLRSQNSRLMPVRYSYSEIKQITKSFKEKLGEGGYGSVYKGKLRSGRFAAIKMLDKSNADGQDFINEVATIGRIHHVNVVQLIGFCVEGSKRALIYEFMENGSLDKHIFFKEGGLLMNNKMIFDISLGVAHGIEYLHQGCDMQILHFDIKPHNILLDEKFIPKISDFGLAKLHSTDHSIVSLTAARGTIGYIAPEFFYKTIGGISYKADVYSFGKLLMEMAGRRKNINEFTEHSSRVYFPSWIYDHFNEEKEIKLGDETAEGSNMVKKMIIVALWCLQLHPVHRPSMHKVIEMLEGEVEHLKMPPKPLFAPQETPINDAGLSTNPELYASSDCSDTISLLID